MLLLNWWIFVCVCVHFKNFSPGFSCMSYLVPIVAPLHLLFSLSHAHSLVISHFTCSHNLKTSSKMSWQCGENETCPSKTRTKPKPNQTKTRPRFHNNIKILFFFINFCSSLLLYFLHSFQCNWIFCLSTHKNHIRYVLCILGWSWINKIWNSDFYYFGKFLGKERNIFSHKNSIFWNSKAGLEIVEGKVKIRLFCLINAKIDKYRAFLCS